MPTAASYFCLLKLVNQVGAISTQDLAVGGLNDGGVAGCHSFQRGVIVVDLDDLPSDGLDGAGVEVLLVFAFALLAVVSQDGCC